MLLNEKLTDSLGNIVELHYISGGNGLCGVYVRTAGGDTLYHAFTDYQSNLIALAGQDGGSVIRLAYDPWGNRVEASDWNVESDASDLRRIGVNRGYTMHEYLDEFNLINMNGRMYDPWLLQFLSPDPYVQAPGNWLNYNRYAYCYGNPMSFNDPNGEWIQFLIGALVGGVLNWVANGCEFSWRGLGYFGAGAAIGAGTVALGGWVAGATQCAGVITGAAVGAGVGAATGAVSSVVLNGLNNVIGGQNFWNNWQGSLISGASSGAIGGVIGGGIKGYHLAKDGGRNMWWGGKIKPGRTQWSFFNSEKPQIFKSPVHNNYGTQNGECALRCLEKISESYGLTQNDYEYWYSQNGSKLGVDPLEFENMVNSSGVLSAKSISGINSISEAFSNDQRVVMGLSYNGEGHAVMVNKVKMWSDGTYRIFFKETSPSWIVPRSTNNVFNIKGFRFWSVYK